VLQRPLSEADTHPMKKDQLLWGLGSIALAFAYIAAVNIDVVTVQSSPTLYGGTYTRTYRSCDGLWDPTKWLDSSCSSTLPPRLGTMAIGIAIFLVCGYFAAKNTPQIRYHDVWQRPDDGKYWCRDCSFQTHNVESAQSHRRIPFVAPRVSMPTTTTVVSTPNAFGFGSSAANEPRPAGPGPSDVPAPPTPQAANTSRPAKPNPTEATSTSSSAELKTCPDCAEQVRAPARKCRFCGYRFDEHVSDATKGALGPGLRGNAH
jgi:uncharacterized protein UPF0547